MAIGMNRINHPIAVTPRWCLRIEAHSSFDRGADPAPRRSAGALRIPVEPDTGRLADQVRLGHEAPDPAILAVVAIVAHHEIVSGRHRATPHRPITQQARDPRLSVAAVVTADLLAVTP